MDGSQDFRDISHWQQQQQQQHHASRDTTPDAVNLSTEVEGPVRFNRQAQRSTRAMKESGAASSAHHQRTQSHHEINLTSHHDQRVEANAFPRSAAPQLARHAAHTSNYHANPATAQMAIAEAGRVSDFAPTAPMYSHHHATRQVGQYAHSVPLSMRQHGHQIVSDADQLAIQRYLAEAQSEEDLAIREAHANRELAYQMATIPRTEYIATPQKYHRPQAHSRQPSVMLRSPADNVHLYNAHMIDPPPGYQYFQGYIPVAAYPPQLHAQDGVAYHHIRAQPAVHTRTAEQAWAAQHQQPSLYRARGAQQARIAGSLHSTTGSNPETRSSGVTSSTPYTRTSFTRSSSPAPCVPITSMQQRSLAASHLSTAPSVRDPGIGHQYHIGRLENTQLEDGMDIRVSRPADISAPSSYDISGLDTSGIAPDSGIFMTTAQPASPSPPSSNAHPRDTQVKNYIPDPPGPPAVFSTQTEKQIEHLMLGNKRTLNRGRSIRGPAIKRSKPNPEETAPEEPYRLQPKARIGRERLSSPFGHTILRSQAGTSSDVGRAEYESGYFVSSVPQSSSPRNDTTQLKSSQLKTTAPQAAHIGSSQPERSQRDTSSPVVLPHLASEFVPAQPKDVADKPHRIPHPELKHDDPQLHKYKTRSKKVEAASPLLSLEGPVREKKVVVLPVALSLPAPAVETEQRENSEVAAPSPPAARGSSIRMYLNDKVTPHVQLALKRMYEADPERPLLWLANFLSQRSDEFEGPFHDADAEGEPDEVPLAHLEHPHFNHPSSFDFEAEAAQTLASLPDYQPAIEVVPAHLDAEQFSAELMQMEDPNRHVWDMQGHGHADAVATTTVMEMSVKDDEEMTSSDLTPGSPSSGSSWQS